jgi:hypothetical protein
MELLTTLFLFLAALAIVTYGIITEATDWVGRAEIIEKRWPGLWSLMNNRPMRLILLVVAIVMIAHATQELQAGVEPAEVKFPPSRVPALAPTAAPTMEADDSLRHRTLKLADRLQEYFEQRVANHPSYAYPNSADPNPSDERRKQIQECQKYDRETMDYYNKHFRDVMVGIIREYNVKGVKTGWLETQAERGNLNIPMPEAAIENSAADDLKQFRDLAYRVDARDNLIVF